MLLKNCQSKSDNATHLWKRPKSKTLAALKDWECEAIWVHLLILGLYQLVNIWVICLPSCLLLPFFFPLFLPSIHFFFLSFFSCLFRDGVYSLSSKFIKWLKITLNPDTLPLAPERWNYGPVPLHLVDVVPGAITRLHACQLVTLLTMMPHPSPVW